MLLPFGVVAVNNLDQDHSDNDDNDEEEEDGIFDPNSTVKDVIIP